MPISKFKIKLLALGLMFIGVASFNLASPPPVSAETKTEAQLQQAATDKCKTEPAAVRAACRSGYRAGYEGTKNPQQACVGRVGYTQDESFACLRAYSAGKDQKLQDGEAEAPPAGADKTVAQVQDAAEAKCGTGAGAEATCRNGYRTGYFGTKTVEQACENRAFGYNEARRLSCKSGYAAGKAARSSEAGPAAVVNKCDTSFFGFPKWNKYLPLSKETGNECAPKLEKISDIWLILLAIIELLLRIAVIAAIAFVLIGGIKYITSAGNPEKTAKAKNTVVDGLVGLVIAIVATAVVSFIAGRFQG